jgi:hypothetical protein
MRLSIMLALLLAACAGAPPRPMPVGQEWTRGRAVVVTSEVQLWPDLKQRVDADLQQAGFRVLAFPEGKGELRVAVKKYDGSNLHVDVDRDGQLVDSLVFNMDSEPVCTHFPATNITSECAAREVAARVVESPKVAAAGKAAPAEARPASGKLAVLELRNFASDLTPQNAQYFTDMVRSTALRVQPGLEVMTRENLLVLLQSTGKRIEECEGECEVDTGRRIGADRIVTGELQKLGTSYKLTLRLHDTREGRLLSSQVASGKTIDELDAAAGKAAEQLFH